MNNDPLWYKDAVFYEIHIRAFADGNGDGIGDFIGLTGKLDYIQSLGVDCIWLMPFYPSPLVDDGYDIADYAGVNPDYGTLDDVRAMLEAAHARGIRVIADLVLNHTSDQHRWFQSSRASVQSPLRDYYIWSPTPARFGDARIIFIDTQTSNWQYDPQTQEYFFHRFYPQQPDLNYDNPRVQQAMTEVMRFWLDQGLDGFRCDAVPYLFKREGTNCENLPETHTYLKQVRRFVDEHYPGRILLAEANQWPADVRPYFGDGDEFNLCFHFPLMPRIFYALKAEKRDSILWAMERTPQIPDNAQWCTFLRNHDELTLEMVTAEEREFLWTHYAPQDRMRLNLGIRRRLAPLLDNNVDKILVANSLLLTLAGSPIIYYGDEIGMGDNIGLKDRDGVRTPMQWSDQPNGGFSTADKLFAPAIDDGEYSYRRVNVAREEQDPNSLLSIMRHLMTARKKYRAFGRGATEFVDLKNDHVLAYERKWGDERILVVNNLSGEPQPIHLGAFAAGAGWDILVQREFDFPSRAQLEPYEFLWLLLDEG
ncbi:MAG: maltose alpha-D-glucosyltransferase [Anaerolineae bacterium]